MNRKEVTEFLNEIETRYPVHEWQLRGIDIWPALKFEIFGRWRLTVGKSYNELVKGKKKAKGKRSSWLMIILHSLFRLLKLFLSPRQPIPIIFSGAVGHRIQLEGQYINRYFDPMIRFLKVQFAKPVLLVEYTPEMTSKKYESKEDIIFMAPYVPAIKLLLFWQKKSSTDQLSQFGEFLIELEKTIPSATKDIQPRLSDLVWNIKVRAFFFSILFEKHKPNYAVGLCYYSSAMYGMNYAAHRLNIPTIDLQHGGMGNTHPAYFKFHRLPERGYNTLPKIFWCWDTHSAALIKTWSSGQQFHKAIVRGNPWTSYFIQEKRTQERIADKKIILYTLQFNFPEPFIVEAIRQSPPEYQWWLRLHPRTLSVKGELLNFLQQEGIFEKVEIERATSIPLTQLLLNCVIHVSRSSGSIIEAAQVGVKTIIIDETGVEHYREYLENNEAIAFLEMSSIGMLKVIRENERGDLDSAFQIPDYKSAVVELLEKKI